MKKLRYLGLLISLTLVALVSIAFGISIKMVLLLPLAIASGPLFVIDVKSKRLPNAITYPAITSTMAIAIVGAIATKSPTFFTESLVKGISLFLLFLILHLLTQGGVGAGDVKLAMLVGLALGPFHADHLLAIAILSFLLAALNSAIQLMRARATLQSRLPFGPFLITATWIVILLPRLVS